MNIDKNIENNITEFVNNINKKRDNKFTENEKEKIINNLHPFRMDLVSTIIYIIGFIIFVFLWYFLKAESYLSKKTYWSKYVVYILFITVTILNIYFSSEEPTNYESEITIQRSVEKNAFYVAAGSLALALFSGSIVKFFKADKKAIRLPFLFFSLAFIFAYLILLFINLPKIGIFVHYYRNIISQFLNLSIIFIISAIIFIIALIKN